jgi:hypothetical protein
MMKKVKAFTLIELVVAFTIVVLVTLVVGTALFLAVHYQASQKQSTAFNVGDVVYIEGLNFTGRVNSIERDGKIDIISSTSNSTIMLTYGINPTILKKVKSSPEWTNPRKLY